MAHELQLRGIPFHEQTRLQVIYKEIIAGEYRADFVIDDKVIIEIKATKALTEVDEAQLINYPSTVLRASLKGTGYRVGLLANFGTSSLEHIRRVV